MGHHAGQDFCSSEMFRGKYGDRGSEEQWTKGDELIQTLP